MCQRRLQEFRAENERSGLGGKGKGSEGFKSNLRQGLAQSASRGHHLERLKGGQKDLEALPRLGQGQFPWEVNQKGIESADFLSNFINLGTV